MTHPVSASCGGEKCNLCSSEATHKVGEEILDDKSPPRHNYTAYVCCQCFSRLFGLKNCGT